MSSKGQTINDRLNAAKYTLAGQSLARCICKATTEELMKPKKKHLDYLAASTYESNVSMMQLANLLIERTNHSNWAVVYKSLITVHHLMSFGNERFTQYLASSNYSFQLSGFLDRIVAKGYAMSTFIRRYSNYINQKALSYRTLAIDLCRTQRGENNVLRTMPIERLLEALPIIQKQLDVLLDFGCTSGDLSNGIIVASFTLLFHDAIRLFASYNDGIINLFEKYFDLNKKMCREAFEAYKKFLSCTDRVAEFLRIAEAIDLNRGDLPDFKRAPSSLLDAFEQHLISLETNKKRDKTPVNIDTKSAAFPSFSVSNDFDLAPPGLSDSSTDFDSGLNFSSDVSGTNESKESTQADNPMMSTTTSSSEISSNLSHSPPPLTATNILAKPQPPMASASFTFGASFEDPFATPTSVTNPFGDPQDNEAFGSKSVIPAAPISAHANILSSLSSEPIMQAAPQALGGMTNQQSQGTAISGLNNNDLFDIRPPGFFDSAVLQPEAGFQISIDPSIDPQTQQQLIQIKREQEANKQQWQQSGNIGRQSENNNYNPNRSAAASKSKKESMFEDLEKTMRQSLKIEKT